MKIEKEFSLKNFNTLKVATTCKYFCVIKDVKDLLKILDSTEFKNSNKFLVLGGGSNLLLTSSYYEGFVIKNEIKYKKIIKSENEKVFIEFGAGEIWDAAVRFCTNKNLGGIENMAYIPGTVGGAAVQNIAAYDQNIEDCFYSLNAINKKTSELKTFYKEECEFEYRNSKFKKDGNEWIVVSVTLILNKNAEIDTKYYETGLNKTSVQQELESISKPPYKIIDMYKAIVSLRKKRIPSEKEFPNPGSFFRNPVASKDKYLEIKKEIETLQFYPIGKVKYVPNEKITEDTVKISYGQLFDLGLGMRGFKKGNVGISEKNAAFIYTNGNATGEEIKNFSEELKKKIFDKYGIKLVEEVKIII